MRPAYRYHRQFLQLLQWKHPRNPWVLKSPAHLWSLDELLGEYPDARFIQTHRDPLRMLASLDATSKPVGLAEAVSRLKRICLEQVFQPRRIIQNGLSPGDPRGV